MGIELKTPGVDELDDVVRALRNWQRDDAPIQLHPGDLGWHWRFGAEVLAAAVRTWSRGGKILAIGFLDSPDVLRMTVAPEVWREDELVRAVASDLSEPESGILSVGKVSVEVPDSTRLQGLLSDGAWINGDPWTPLGLEVAAPVDEMDLWTEVVALPEQVSECTTVPSCTACQCRPELPPVRKRVDEWVKVPLPLRRALRRAASAAPRASSAAGRSSGRAAAQRVQLPAGRSWRALSTPTERCGRDR